MTEQELWESFARVREAMNGHPWGLQAMDQLEIVAREQLAREGESDEM